MPIEQIDMRAYYQQLADEAEQKRQAEIEKEKTRKENLNNLTVMNDDYTGLTDRQIALVEYYKDYESKHRSRPTDFETLTKGLDDMWYNYRIEMERYPYRKFNDTTARRQLTEDKEALEFHTGISHIFIGNGFAKNDWEIRRQILTYRSKMKKNAKKMTICQMKAARNNQLGFDLKTTETQDKIKVYESKIKIFDKEINDIETELKDGDKLYRKTKKRSKK
jgi:uncharacterized protein YihD (DUF1040 family)